MTGKDAVATGNANWEKLFAAQDWQGVSNLYTEDCKVFFPGKDVISGRQSLPEVWKGVFQSGTTRVTLKLTHLEEKDSNKAVADEGQYTMYNAAGAEVDTGKYVEVWKKVGGKWLLHYDIFNSDKHAPSPKPKPMELQDQISSAYSEWEHRYMSRNFTKLAELYTPDCKVCSPGHPMTQGRDACAQMFEGAAKAGTHRIVMQSSDVVDMGDGLASDASYYWMYDEAGNQLDSGKAVVIWKKVDGDWKLYYDIFNTNRS